MTPSGSQSLLPAPNPSVVCNHVTEGGVLLSAEDEVYYGLNQVGLEIWENLPPKLSTLEEMYRAIGDSYPEVDPATIRADVDELLDDLRKNNLVHDREALANEPPSESSRPHSP